MKNKLLVIGVIVVLVIAISVGVWAIGIPHPLIVNVQNSSGVSPGDGDLTFNAWLTKDTESILTQSSTGCSYSSATGCYVECGNFTTAWTAGDIVHIEVEQTSTGDVGVGEFTLTNDNFQLFSGENGLIIAPVPNPTEVWVDDNYTEGNCDGHTWLVDAFDNIQDGINGVDEGGTVYVAAGTYDEVGQIDIDKNLTIIGADKATTIIKPDHDTTVGGYVQSEAWIYVPSGVTFALSEVTLDGTDLTGTLKTIHHAIQSRGELTVEDCIIKNIKADDEYLGRGIVLLAGTSNTIARCEFSAIQRIGIHVRGSVEPTNPIAYIEDCTYVGKGAGDWLDYGIEFGGGGSGTVDGCTITDCSGDESGWRSAGIYATTAYGTATSATITGCDIYDNSHGVWIGYDDADTTVATLTDNNIYNNDEGVVIRAGTNVVTGHYNNIYGNEDYGVNVVSGSTTHDFENNWWGDASGPSGEGPGTGDAVSTNVDYNPWYNTSALSTKTYYVGSGEDYTTIQDAIDAASAGDTIIVTAGTYHNDPTNVNKQITLLGANANVDPAGSTDRGGETILTRDDTKSGFYVTASGVTINGFKLGTSTAESSRRINIYDGATDVIIKYNIIMNTWQSSGHGVYIHPASDRAEISYNTIDNPYWDGIRNDGAEDVVISNNYVNDVNNNLGTFPIVTTGRAVISGNTVTNSRDGIRIDYAGGSTSDRVEVIGNTVSYIEYAGIGMGYGSTDKGKYTYVYNNTVHHANYFGSDGLGDWDYASIHVEEGATNCIIDGNTVYDGVNGIQTWASNVTITNNEIYDMGVTYTGDGFGPAGTKTVGGRVYKNSGILVGSNWGSGDIDPTGVVIENNNIHDNYWGLFYSADLANGVDATNNWWGAASGPTHTSNPGGTGDAVSDNVNFIPFLASSGGEVVNNVSITKSGPTSANSGVNITYTITYKNIGTNYATNVVITETYPSEVEYVSATLEPDSGFNNKWTIGTLAPGAEGTIAVTVHIK